MKTILIGSFPVSLPLYQYLSRNNLLDSVCFQESEIKNVKKDFWLNSIQKEGFDTFLINPSNIEKQFKTWLSEKQPDLVIVFGFSLKIPPIILEIPKYGFANIHFGKLPENKGPDPLFRTLQQGKSKATITIHKMDNQWDSGDVIVEQEVPVIPGETYGMANSKMSYMVQGLVEKVLTKLQAPALLTPQLPQNSQYYKRPTLKETSINWETQTAQEIENLVNACNPKYQGATTYYQGAPVKILEVSPVDGQVPLLGKTAGEIVHAHPQEGIYVSCKYGQIIRINTLSSDAGILTGTKYVHLGVRQGHRFTSGITSNHPITM